MRGSGEQGRADKAHRLTTKDQSSRAKSCQNKQAVDNRWRYVCVYIYIYKINISTHTRLRSILLATVHVSLLVTVHDPPSKIDCKVGLAMALLAIMTMSALAFRAALGGQQEPREPSSVKLGGLGCREDY